jgi:hypothetical protein
VRSGALRKAFAIQRRQRPRLLSSDRDSPYCLGTCANIYLRGSGCNLGLVRQSSSTRNARTAPSRRQQEYKLIAENGI